MNWTEKYRPKHLEEVIGNREAKEKLLEWAREWQVGNPSKKAVIIYGKPGVGKTSAAHALAKDFGWEVVELNASDDRNREIIKRVALTGAVSEILGSPTDAMGRRVRRLIILDEADNLYERNGDAGGKGAIIETIKAAKQPIILLANDYYALVKGRGSELKKLCIPIEFGRVRRDEIISLLERICREEGIEYEREALEAIAMRCDGDVRSAINDLQSMAYGRKITKDMLSHLGYRDREVEIFSTLRIILRTRDMRTAVNQARLLDESPDNLILWIDENIPAEYRNSYDLARAYYFLSRADVFLGRTWRRQYYGLWRYAFELMTGGVAAAKKHDCRGFVKYSFPSWLRKMAAGKQERYMKYELAKKMGKRMHCSSSKAMEILPLIKKIFMNPEMASRFAASAELKKEEIEYLVGEKEKAEEIYKMAEKMRKMDKQSMLFNF